MTAAQAAPVGTEAGSEALAADLAPADSDQWPATIMQPRPRVRRTGMESCSGFPTQNAETEIVEEIMQIQKKLSWFLK